MTLPDGSFDKFWDAVVLRNFPKAKIRFKDESWLFKYILRFVLFFQRKFMTDFITVVGTTVYFPSKKHMEDLSDGRAICICAHEMMHMWDKRVGKKFGIDWFSIKYLLPQGYAIFSLFAFFAFTNLWFLICLGFLLFLAPWPSKWRVQSEARGYAMSLHCWEISIPEYNVPEGIEGLLPLFTTNSYYWMSWDVDSVRQILTDYYETLPNTHAAFKEVGEWLKTHQT